MAGEQGFTPLSDLIQEIAALVREMEGGAMDLASLDNACERVRELNERVIVLRHKAREEMVKAARSGSASAPPEIEIPSMRLETGPPADPRQITLIDAIENEKSAKREKRERRVQEQTPKVAAALTAEPAPVFKLRAVSSGEQRMKTTVAEKLERAPIKDLGKAIAISEKFWFVAELFGRDASAYDQTIKRINMAGGLVEAKAIIDAEVVKKAKKPMAEEALASFLELVERRFK